MLLCFGNPSPFTFSEAGFSEVETAESGNCSWTTVPCSHAKRVADSLPELCNAVVGSCDVDVNCCNAVVDGGNPVVDSCVVDVDCFNAGDGGCRITEVCSLNDCSATEDDSIPETCRQGCVALPQVFLFMPLNLRPSCLSAKPRGELTGGTLCTRCLLTKESLSFLWTSYS